MSDVSMEGVIYTARESDDGTYYMEVDDGDSDDANYNSSSGGQSIASSFYKGYIENGRRYQSIREGDYWGPSDDEQFQSMNAAHIMALVMESNHPNNLFRSPIGENAKNILDIGTGNGAWAVDVADRYPDALVQGVDLFPVPDTWMPANCRFEVDDVLEPWMFKENSKFDLCHLRFMVGAFTPDQWEALYKQIYDNLAPGGWIEHFEPQIGFYCDDGTLPQDSIMANWATLFGSACAASGKPFTEGENMRSRMEKVGFGNIQEKRYKVPFGTWPKNPTLKEAGKFNEAQFVEGMEGYTLFLLTKHGQPKPWSPEEVRDFLVRARAELTSGWHMYWWFRRTWAQKPAADTGDVLADAFGRADITMKPGPEERAPKKQM